MRASKQGRPELIKAWAAWRAGHHPIMRKQRKRTIFILETGTTTQMVRLRGHS